MLSGRVMCTAGQVVMPESCSSKKKEAPAISAAFISAVPVEGSEA
jgi:hypothetical protein